MNSIHRRSLCSSPPAPPLDIAALRRAAAPRDGPALKTVYETTQLRACVYYTTTLIYVSYLHIIFDL